MSKSCEVPKFNLFLATFISDSSGLCKPVECIFIRNLDVTIDI